MKLATCFYVNGPRPKSPSKSPGEKKKPKSPADADEKLALKSRKKLPLGNDTPLIGDKKKSSKKDDRKLATHSNLNEGGFFGTNETEADFIASGFASDEDDSALMMAGNAFAIDSFVMKFEEKAPRTNAKNETGWPWNLNCSECGRPMDEEAHYQMALKRCEGDNGGDGNGAVGDRVTKRVCRYVTNCRSAYDNHRAHFHGGLSPPDRVMEKENAADRYACVDCDFEGSAKDMTVHMAKMGHRVCRPYGAVAPELGGIVIASVSSIVRVGDDESVESENDADSEKGEEEEEGVDCDVEEEENLLASPMRMVKREMIEGYSEMTCQYEGFGRLGTPGNVRVGESAAELQPGARHEEMEEEDDDDDDDDQNYPDSETVGKATTLGRSTTTKFSKAKALFVKKELT